MGTVVGALAVVAGQWLTSKWEGERRRVDRIVDERLRTLAPLREAAVEFAAAVSELGSAYSTDYRPEQFMDRTIEAWQQISRAMKAVTDPEVRQLTGLYLAEYTPAIKTLRSDKADPRVDEEYRKEFAAEASRVDPAGQARLKELLERIEYLLAAKDT